MLTTEQLEYAYNELRHGWSCNNIAKHLGVSEDVVLDAVYGPAYPADSLEAIEE